MKFETRVKRAARPLIEEFTASLKTLVEELVKEEVRKAVNPRKRGLKSKRA
jgi:hypothetical protein